MAEKVCIICGKPRGNPDAIWTTRRVLSADASMPARGGPK
nr:MAG TPA: anti-sigma factor [Caudoviricetes sp.]